MLPNIQFAGVKTGEWRPGLAHRGLSSLRQLTPLTEAPELLPGFGFGTSPFLVCKERDAPTGDSISRVASQNGRGVKLKHHHLCQVPGRNGMRLTSHDGRAMLITATKGINDECAT